MLICRKRECLFVNLNCFLNNFLKKISIDIHIFVKIGTFEGGGCNLVLLNRSCLNS